MGKILDSSYTAFPSIDNVNCSSCKTQRSKKQRGPRTNAIILRTNKNNDDQAEMDREFQQTMADSNFLRKQIRLQSSLARQSPSPHTPNLYIPMTYNQSKNHYGGRHSPCPTSGKLGSSPRCGHRMNPYPVSPAGSLSCSVSSVGSSPSHDSPSESSGYSSAGSSSDLQFGVKIPVENMTVATVGYEAHIPTNDTFPTGNLFVPEAQTASALYPHGNGSIAHAFAHQNQPTYWSGENSSSIHTPMMDLSDGAPEVISLVQGYPIQYAQDATYANVSVPRYVSTNVQCGIDYQPTAGHWFSSPNQRWINEFAEMISVETQTQQPWPGTNLFPVVQIQEQSSNVRDCCPINQQTAGTTGFPSSTAPSASELDASNLLWDILDDWTCPPLN